MARTATPTPEIREVPVNEALIAQDFQAANQLAAIQQEADRNAREVAKQLGYQLPADATDPDLIQRDIAANMRRSVEACLEVGRGLTVLKAACGHGNFTARLEVLGIDKFVASRFMQSAAKFTKLPSNATLHAIGNQTKLFEMLVLDDEQIEELEQDGQTGNLSLDDVATMSVKELRMAVRKEREDRKKAETVSERLSAVNRELHSEVERIKILPPDEALADLQAAATRIAADALGAIQGGVRQALNQLSELPEGSIQPAFAAGLIGQLQAELNQLRNDFGLPDVANAADQQLAAEVGAWAGKD